MNHEPEKGFDEKHLTRCPRCGDELKPFIPLESFFFPEGLILDSTYCPACDIMKEHSWRNYLCSDCNSPIFYNFGGKDYCFMCNGSMRIFNQREVELLEENDGFRQGYRTVFGSDLPERKHCTDTPGNLMDLLRVSVDVFDSLCTGCGETVYIQISFIDQAKAGWVGRKEIPAHEYLMMMHVLDRMRPAVINFRDERELTSKIGKLLDREIKKRLKKRPDERLP